MDFRPKEKNFTSAAPQAFAQSPACLIVLPTLTISSNTATRALFK
jgi:hypothetical protein